MFFISDWVFLISVVGSHWYLSLFSSSVTIFMNITLHSLTSALSFSVVWSFFIWVICQLSSFCLYFGVLFKCYVSWPLEVMASWRSLLFPGNCRFRACLCVAYACCFVLAAFSFSLVICRGSLCLLWAVFGLQLAEAHLMWVGLHVKRPAATATSGCDIP